jgi:hypothetical protein
MLTIPVAGMPFQIYPEVAAGLVIAVVVHHLLFAKAPTTAGALGAGLLAGFLPWLHVRFLAIWVLLVLCAPFFYPRSRLSRVFVGVAGLGLASLCVYAYHITGSFLPTAMYGAAGAPQNMEPHLIGPGLLGYLYDRDYGLLPYSPIYLLAIPCLLPWIRHERGRALFIIAIGLALAIPSAAHGWNSAGGTPLRHLTAIVPLAMLPLADAWRRGDRGRLFWIAALVLLFFSLQNAYAYNQFHRKDIGPMLDQSASGWKTLLLFPRVFAVEPMTRKTFTPTGLLYVWIAATAALAVAALVTRESKGKGSGRLDAWPIEALTAAGILIVVLAGLAVSAWTGVATDASYMR